MYIEGINPLLSYPNNVETPQPFRVGQRGRDQLGREWVFCNSLLAVTAGDVLMLPLGNTGVPTPLTTAGALYNRQVGVSQVTFAALATVGTGFWAQVYGPTPIGIKTSAAVAINTAVYTTATSAAVDDTAAASNLIRGMTLTTAAGGAAVAVGLLNYPTIGTVADTDNNT